METLQDTNHVLELNTFTIKDKIKEGGFATVYTVLENETNEIYAAKAINAKGKVLADQLMINQEIEVFAKINHPAILKFRGMSLTNFENEPYPTIFTKYMPCGSLGEMIRKAKQNKAPENWNNTKKMIVIIGICHAMNYLHSNGIIHRDLKPDNVLLDEKYYPFIGDFGLSKLVKGGNSNQKPLNGGTPIFMAPEIYTNSPLDSKVDVYAFAMLLYQLLTNVEPFGEFSRNYFMLWHKILSGSRPPFKDSVPQDFQDLIKRCWDRNPQTRPTFTEIIEMIDNKSLMLPDVDQDEIQEYKNYLIHVE